MNQPQRTLVPALALVVLTAALTACGGTSSGTPSAGTPAPASPVGFTGTLDGTLSSLSGSGFTVGAQSVSLALSGLALQVQTATTVTVNGDASSSEVLAAGQDVHVVVSNGVASQVEVRIEVRGRVDAVDVTGGTLTVAGQTVAVGTGTRISLGDAEAKQDAPTHTLADLAALTSPVVEVTGVRDAQGVIQASRIEVRTPAQQAKLNLGDAEVAGKVSSLDSAARTFVVNGVTVSYTSAALHGDPLVAGAGVEVRGRYDDTAKVLNATRVNVRAGGEPHASEHPAAGARLAFEAEITGVDAAAHTLTAGGYTVDLSGAAVTGTPAVGAKAEVTGAVDPASATLIHAVRVEIEAAPERRFEGVAAAVSSGGLDLTLSGPQGSSTVHVDLSAAAVDGTPVSGLPAVVYGHYSSAAHTVIVASKVLGPKTRTLDGRVRDLNTQGSRFRLGEQTVLYGSARVSGTLAAGAQVSVSGLPGVDASGAKVLNAQSVTVK